jgi:hypothetical protein
LNISKIMTMAAIRLPKPYILGVTIPKQLTDTLENIMTAGQVIGVATAGVILVIAGVQLMTGGRNNVEMGKTRIICLIVGLILVSGCSVLKTFLVGLMGF